MIPKNSKRKTENYNSKFKTSSSNVVQTRAKILSHKKIAPGYFLLKLDAPVIGKFSLPGQFVHLRVFDSDVPLLRRPFSLHRINPDSIELLYEVKGEGTRILSERKKDEMVDLIGPLGNGFDLADIPEGKNIILIAGGIGVAPLVSLVDALLKQYDRERLIFFLGARSQKLILGEREIRHSGIECLISTDDGSCGERGPVTRLFEKKLADWRENPGMVFACGPEAMLKVMGSLSRRFKFLCQVSLEENMGCGIGACLGCVVRLRTNPGQDVSFEYKRVCKDGPVFLASGIIFE